MTERRPELLSLHDLFAKRVFSIPNYQRLYDWENKHCQDLLDDIKNSYKEGRIHFMATIVTLNQGTELVKAVEQDKVDIVDGQQRITTLVILYRAICKHMNENEEKELRNGINKILIKKEGALLLLQSNHQRSDILSKYIESGEMPSPVPKALAVKRLCNAMTYCEKFVKEWKTSGVPLEKLLSHVNNKINFVYYNIEDPRRVYPVFDALNSRGLAVSWIDRLKNMLIRIIFDKKCGDNEYVELQKRWADINDVVDEPKIGVDVLCFSATLLRPHKSKIQPESSSAHLLKDESTNVAALRTNTRLIQNVAKAIQSIKHNYEYSFINKLRPVRLVAVAIECSKFKAKEKSELIEHVVKTAFCMYVICQLEARKETEKYVKLAYEIKNNKNIIVNDVKASLTFIASEHDVNKNIDELLTRDSYSKQQDKLRYLLYNYEKSLISQAGWKMSDSNVWNLIWNETAAKTIEHIWPKSKYRDWVHWLGNLLILPPDLNSTLNAKPPTAKIDAYANTGLLMASEVKDQLPSWDENAVRERGERMAQWMREEWLKEFIK